MTPTDETDPVDLPLRAGDSGPAVRDLQVRLRRVGLPVAGDVVGHFGSATGDAVTTFQERVGLSVTGTCDAPTWAALVEAGYTLGDRLLYHRVPMLRGDDVATLQRRLSELGFHSGRVDGIFGPETEDAVRSFQRNTGLVTDGVAGPDVVAQLSRLGPGGGSLTKSVIAERLHLLATPHDLRGVRLAIGEPGTLPALIRTITGRLDDIGAHALAIHHPDGSAQAAEANRFDAYCFIGCTTRTEPGARLSFYRTEGFESAGGSRLAELVAAHLTREGFPSSVSLHGMRLPVLRETRMPALWCEIGPTAWVVDHAPELARVLVDAMTEWMTSPVRDDT